MKVVGSIPRDSAATLLGKNVGRLLPAVHQLEVFECEAYRLLVPQRFDLAIKALYVHDYAYRSRSNFARHIYLAHIRAFNGFVEMDHSRKRGPAQFELSFQDLIESIVSTGLTEDFLVPVSPAGILLDGAHRVSVCLALGLPVKFVVTDGGESPNYDASYFQSRGLEREFVDAGAMEYLRRSTNTRLALVWPSAVGNEAALLDTLSKHTVVVSRKDVRVEGHLPVNLTKVAYSGEPWLGDSADDFAGARAKMSYCFRGPGPLRVFLLAGSDTLRSCKSDVREIYDARQHAIHITDDHDETQRVASLLFSENSLRAASICPPSPPKWFERMFEIYDEWVRQLPASVDRELLCVGGSSVLAAYGARDIRDLDFLYAGPEKLVTGFRDIAQHVGSEQYLPVTLGEIVADPSRHFYYSGRKFLTLGTLRQFKSKRAEMKDHEDIRLIDALGDNDAPHLRRKRRLAALLNPRMMKGLVKLGALRANFAIRAWFHGRRVRNGGA